MLAQTTRPTMRIGLKSDGPLVVLDERDGALYHQRDQKQALRIGVAWGGARASGEVGCWFEAANATMNTAGDWAQGLSSEKSTIEFRARRDAGTVNVVATMRGKPKGEGVVMPNLNRFLDPGLFAPQGAFDPGFAQALTAWRLSADQLAERLSSRGIRYLGALRGGPLMSREAKGSNPRAGHFGEGTLRILSALQLNAPPQRRAWLARVASRFEIPELAAGYALDALDATYMDARSGTNLSIANAGFGSQQALPVLADLADMEAGGTLLVEELEHSSHPKWLPLWAETLVESVTQLGQQIIATTHAPHFVLALGLLVKRGKIDPRDVIVHELVREDEIDVREWSFDKRGRLNDGWIESFGAAERELVNELLDNGKQARKTRTRSR